VYVSVRAVVMMIRCLPVRQ